MSATTPASTDGPGPPDIADIARDIIKEEHKQRRQEISDIRGRLERDDRNALALTGAIWAWLATHPAELAGSGRFVVILPAVLMGFYLYRWHAIHKSIFGNAEYLRELEARAGLGPLGWETWLQHKRESDPLRVNLARAGLVFWVGLILVNLVLAILFCVFRAGA